MCEADGRTKKKVTSKAVETMRYTAVSLELIDVASKAAKESQEKVTKLEEGGIKRAGETLQLINSLLMITERSATKAAGAQFDFLSRTIDNLDHECKTLITEATKDDERDIIAKTA